MTDRKLSYCPSRARTKNGKIWVILHMFYLAVSNGWLQYEEDQKSLAVSLHKIMQLRTYKLEYGQILIENNDVIPQMFDDDVDAAQTVPIAQRNALTPISSKTRRFQGPVHLLNITAWIQNWHRLEKCNKNKTICKFCFSNKLLFPSTQVVYSSTLSYNWDLVYF